MPKTAPDYRSGEDFARRLDADDALAALRDRFHYPSRPGGEPLIYFCGNSLGLMPKSAAGAVGHELDGWASLAVNAHFQPGTSWFDYHEALREPAARLVGALPGEVVMMNSLTVNLHLMMVSFFRPTAERHKIVVEENAFPSDVYAAQTQLRYHGFDPADALIVARARPGEATLATAQIEALLDERGAEIALVLLGGINYFTGQFFDMKRITEAAHRNGCMAGFNLAHSVGNVRHRLHDWGVDFAVWCSYKYLNGGPGAAAGCFIHDTHARDASLPRFGGWWGNDPRTRFRMNENWDFIPSATADGWQLSNPPILAMAPVRASLAIFDEVGMDALRAKSIALTGYLEYLIDRQSSRRCRLITPRDAERRGCQLSIQVADRPRELFGDLESHGVVGDFRAPDVIRVAPTPLYNTFHEVWRFAQILARESSAPARR